VLFLEACVSTDVSPSKRAHVPNFGDELFIGVTKPEKLTEHQTVPPRIVRLLVYGYSEQDSHVSLVG